MPQAHSWSSPFSRSKSLLVLDAYYLQPLLHVSLFVNVCHSILRAIGNNVCVRVDKLII